MGTTQMFFVKELSTVMGGEAIWRRFVERDEEIPEGEPGAERWRQEIDAWRIWKRHRRCIWWCDNTNPILPGAVGEPDISGIRDPQDLFNFLEEMKRRFKQSSSEYMTKS